jgi:hypothetical protein
MRIAGGSLSQLSSVGGTSASRGAASMSCCLSVSRAVRLVLLSVANASCASQLEDASSSPGARRAAAEHLGLRRQHLHHGVRGNTESTQHLLSCRILATLMRASQGQEVEQHWFSLQLATRLVTKAAASPTQIWSTRHKMAQIGYVIIFARYGHFNTLRP